MPLIEFDPPDFPWMFTPAKARRERGLRPWCVLIVVDLDVVAPRGKPGAPFRRSIFQQPRLRRSFRI